MNVKLIAHTQISVGFLEQIPFEEYMIKNEVTDGQLVALTAIRTCYSSNKPTEIVNKESGKYFGKEATDGGKGTDAERLFRHIVSSGHTSTLEHMTFTFAVEGVSRALLAQLTRHRVGFSYSVQSQRFVRLGSNDKSGGFNYIKPSTIEGDLDADYWFESAMEDLQRYYDKLRELGVPAEDARSVLPNAVATNLVMTANLRAVLDFYAKRKKGRGAQNEITELAEKIRREVTETEPWTEQFFEGV